MTFLISVKLKSRNNRPAERLPLSADPIVLLAEQLNGIRGIMHV